MQRSVLTELHAAAGARLTNGDAPEVLTFGDVPAEYRAAREACALFDAGNRGRVTASGADATAFLHRLLANDVRGLAPGAAQRNLLLSSKGKVLFEVELFREEDRVEMTLPASRAKELLAALDTYLFAEKVTLADASERTSPVELCGPTRFDVVLRATGARVPSERGRFARATFAMKGGGELLVANRPVAGSEGVELDAGPERAAELWRALVAAGARPAGIVARDGLRVEAGAALFGVDVDETVYPQEARLEAAFSLAKGCYVGQEVVAKIDTYGGLNKRLVALRVAHDDPVARGTRLFRLDDGEWRDLGVVTTWAYSFALDAGVVLAYVKRRHQKPGTELRLGEASETAPLATIVPLPLRPDAIAPTGDFE